MCMKNQVKFIWLTQHGNVDFKNQFNNVKGCAVSVTERKAENEKMFVNSLQYLVNSFRKTYIQSLYLDLVLLVTAASGSFCHGL